MLKVDMRIKQVDNGFMVFCSDEDDPFIEPLEVFAPKYDEACDKQDAWFKDVSMVERVLSEGQFSSRSVDQLE